MSSQTTPDAPPSSSATAYGASDTPPLHLRSHRIDGLAPGPRLLVTGAVHGNETCGARGIWRVLAEIDSGALPIERGSVTFVPVTNPLAWRLKQRAGERNLNRNLHPSAIPQDFEDRIANRLCPLLQSHDVLLDLHSFHTGGQPFAMLGPENNSGAIEPFARADDEARLIAHLGPTRIVEGWLDTYARGVARRHARNGAGAARTLESDSNYGVGTTEYMRACGGYAVTLECGQHEDPKAPDVAYRAIRQALALLKIAPIVLEPPPPSHEVIRLVDVVDRLHADDRFAKTWQSFDPVRTGDTIGLRHDGTPVTAPADGRIVFPNPNAVVGQEWFYLATPSPRTLPTR